MSDIFYKSTRDNNEKVTSAEAIVRGIAPDGGLYVPENIPQIDCQWHNLKKMSYKNLSFHIMSKFLTDFSSDELKDCIEKAYDKKFDTPLISPVVHKAGCFFIELYHGPTLAFKDMALSILPHLLKISVEKIGIDKEIVILTATSGDTGKAALEGFADVGGTKIIVFYPKGGVSKIQERQMITQTGNNTYVIAIEGNFDDAQRGVKNTFNDREFNRYLNMKGYMLSSANSINVGRLIPQMVYYFHAYLELINMGEIEGGDKINIVVPTGNFGNILAAYYAMKMGLPVNRLICASNANNVLYDFINTGIYNKNRELVMTSSPSMDILVSSNLERLLYDLSKRDTAVIRALINDLNNTGVFKISDEMKESMSVFYGGFADDCDTYKTIKKVFDEFNYLIDTHTAVGFKVYEEYLEKTGDKSKTVITSTASPFKFPNSVMCAINPDYEGWDDFALIKELSLVSGLEIPERIKNIDKKEILHHMVCPINNIKTIIEEILKF